MNNISKRTTIIMENILNSLCLYYFISDKDDIKTLYPRIPDNFMTRNGYEDNITKRVCFSSSVGGCLTALSMNCENKEFYVYCPIGKYKIYRPTKKQVPDCKITGELWIKDKVNVKLLGKIICHEAFPEPLRYKYGKNNYAELYKWKWDWVEIYKGGVKNEL